MGLMFLQEIQKQVFFFRGQPEFHHGDLQLVTCSQVNCRLESNLQQCNYVLLLAQLRVTPPSSSRVSVSSGGWSTPSGVHTKAAKKGQALAAEVRAPVTSAAKAKFRGTLKCTAEAVLHPDTTTQNLLLWAQLGVFVEVRLGCTCRSACIAPLQSRHAPPEPGQPMLCRDRSVLRGVASYCRGVRHFAVADSGCARNGRPSWRRRSRRCPIGTRPRGLPSRCSRTSRGASRLQHQTLHPAGAVAGGKTRRAYGSHVQAHGFHRRPQTRLHSSCNTGAAGSGQRTSVLLQLVLHQRRNAPDARTIARQFCAVRLQLSYRTVAG